MNEFQFKAFRHRSQEVKELYPSQDTLRTLQSDQMIKSEFPVTKQNIGEDIWAKLEMNPEATPIALFSKSLLYTKCV